MRRRKGARLPRAWTQNRASPAPGPKPCWTCGCCKLLQLLRHELDQLLNLLQLRRQQLDDLLQLLQLLQLHRHELLQMLQLLRHDLQQRKRLLQRLRGRRRGLQTSS